MSEDKKRIAERLCVNPEDINDDGSIKPYSWPVLEDIYPDEPIEQFFTPAQLPPPTPEVQPDDSVAHEKGAFNDINAGYCPGGSWSGGICRPFNNVYRWNWMGYYESALGLKVEEVIRIGTHNSGYDKEAHDSTHNTCQDVSPNAQLNAGVRSLDLRVEFLAGYPLGDPRRFSIFHGARSGRTVQGDFIPAVIKLYTVGAMENVILDFHEFKNFSNEAHGELAGILKKEFGSRIIPPTHKQVVIGILGVLQKNVVIAYNATPRDPQFWEGVNQRWIGHDTPSTTQLTAFIKKVSGEVKPAGELRAIQACKMTQLFYSPDDISQYLMEQFAAGNADSPIMKFYTVNTDWTLRNRLVDNGIFANSKKRQQTLIFADPSRSHNIPYADNVVYSMSDGLWVQELPLRTPNDTKSLVLRTAATLDFSLLLNGNFFISELERIPFVKGDVAHFFSEDNVKWRVYFEEFSPRTTDNGLLPVPKDGQKFSRLTMYDGDFVYRVVFPYTGADGNIFVITSKATYEATILAVHTDAPDQILKTNETYVYVYRAAIGKWSLIQ